MNTQPSIELIIGPMYSCKTSELMRILTMYSTANFKALYINSNIDTRVNGGEQTFSTHNKSLKNNKDITMVKTDHLNDVFDLCQKFDVIAIDEAQFFGGLYDFCTRLCDVEKKKVIVAGLSGTSDRKAFGEITSLIPVCDNVTFLSAFCSVCALAKKIERAVFSMRLVHSENESVVAVGGLETYIPVCRNHFFN